MQVRSWSRVMEGAAAVWAWEATATRQVAATAIKERVRVLMAVSGNGLVGREMPGPDRAARLAAEILPQPPRAPVWRRQSRSTGFSA
jgi:hypothetical protein